MGILKGVFKHTARAYSRDKHAKDDFGEMIVKSIFQLNTMKKIKHHLLNNLVIENSKTSSQIDHVLIINKGIFCIETKNFYGRIYCNDINDKMWIQVANGGSRSFYSPIKQNERHCNVVRAILDNKYIIHSIVVFIKENKPRNAPNFVINFSEFQNYVLNSDIDDNLSDEEVDEVGEFLESYAA